VTKERARYGARKVAQKLNSTIITYSMVQCTRKTDKVMNYYNNLYSINSSTKERMVPSERIRSNVQYFKQQPTCKFSMGTPAAMETRRWSFDKLGLISLTTFSAAQIQIFEGNQKPWYKYDFPSDNIKTHGY